MHASMERSRQGLSNPPFSVCALPMDFDQIGSKSAPGCLCLVISYIVSRVLYVTVYPLCCLYAHQRRAKGGGGGGEGGDASPRCRSFLLVTVHARLQQKTHTHTSTTRFYVKRSPPCSTWFVRYTMNATRNNPPFVETHKIMYLRTLYSSMLAK